MHLLHLFSLSTLLLTSEARPKPQIPTLPGEAAPGSPDWNKLLVNEVWVVNMERSVPLRICPFTSGECNSQLDEETKVSKAYNKIPSIVNKAEPVPVLCYYVNQQYNQKFLKVGAYDKPDISGKFHRAFGQFVSEEDVVPVGRTPQNSPPNSIETIKKLPNCGDFPVAVEYCNKITSDAEPSGPWETFSWQKKQCPKGTGAPGSCIKSELTPKQPAPPFRLFDSTIRSASVVNSGISLYTGSCWVYSDAGCTKRLPWIVMQKGLRTMPEHMAKNIRAFTCF